MNEYFKNYPSINLLLRVNSVFPNRSFIKNVKRTVYLVDELDEITKENKVDYTVVYGKIMYQASSWPY